MNDFYYLIDSGTKSNIAMFSDVKHMPNAVQTSSPVYINNPILRNLYRLHMSIKVNQVLDLPLKGIWDGYYIFKPSSGGTQWIVITNWSIRKFSLSYLKKLSENRQYRLVLIYLDTYEKVPEFYKKYLREVPFDLIYTFDSNDAKQFGWIYTNSLYSRNELPDGGSLQYDLYFIGEDKGRYGQLVQIYNELMKNGLKCCFKIITEDGSHQSSGGLHILRKRIEYKEILEDISKSRAILEIVQNGQSGMTMRPYEAMFYNKRFLTNNVLLESMDFYDSRYMKVFSETDKETVAFLKRTEPVDYHYENEYSPIKWLLKMPEDYQKKGGNDDWKIN